MTRRTMLYLLAALILGIGGAFAGSGATRQVSADSPYCTPGPYYNATQCLAFGNQYNPACTPGAGYNAALCAQYSGTNSIYCQAGANYNPSLCGGYSGSNIYCQAATYNAALCAQYSGTSSSIYCQVGTATYDPNLCAQYNASTTGSIYCQVGTANYNATLCAQYSGTNSIYCQSGPNYNAALCAQYNTSSGTNYCIVGSTAYNPQLCGPTTAAQAITVSAQPATINCGQTSYITASTSIAGSTLNLVSSLGTITPPSSVASGGNIVAVLTTQPGRPGTAVITASSGANSGATQVTVSCAAPVVPTAAPPASSVIPSVPIVPQQPVIQVPPAVQQVRPSGILPPNTGDGGLKHAN